MEDSFSFHISPEELQAVKDQLANINAILEPYISSLSSEERDRLLKEDCESEKSLHSIFADLQRIKSKLSDTIMLLGSDSYESALLYYNSVKSAAKMNVPNAKAIHEDLKESWKAIEKDNPNPSEEI
jgi:hypothetical protein